MEIERSPPKIGKKLWKIVRIVLYMMRKSLSKSKLMLDLHNLLKRGQKAISNAVLLHHHHYSALTCRSDADVSFVSPREYEFSCSNSPAAAMDIFHTKRKNNQHRRQYSIYYNNSGHAEVVNRVLDMLNQYDAAMEASPLPGFGHSPALVRQLRVTDSPFLPEEISLNGGHQVDVDAEEFINKFYRDLKQQKKIAAALEPPSPYHNMWAT